MRPKPTGLPEGPSRLRASDGDRERVVTVVRGHWSQGRLNDEELEQRLGRALSARTLGDLRDLVADLPVAPPSRRERARRASRYAARSVRTRRTVGWLAAVGLGSLFLIGGLASEERTDSAVDRPVAVPAPPPDRPSPEPKITPARIGQVVVDDGVAFRVLRVRRRASVPLRADRGGGEIGPGPNRRFVVAEIRVVNRSRAPVDPFCGSGGAALSVSAGDDLDPIDQLYQVQGNDSICSGGLAPGSGAIVQIVFRLPGGDRTRRLDVWNADSETDRLGKTRIRIRVRS